MSKNHAIMRATWSVLTCTCLLAGTGLAGERGNSWSPTAQVLVPAVADAGIESSEVTARLRALGTPALPDLFTTVSRSQVSVELDTGHRLNLSLRPELREAVLVALCELPWREVRGYLDGVEPEWQGEGSRIAAVEILGRMGGRQDFGLLLRCADPGASSVPPSLRAAFRPALMALCERTGQVPWTTLWREAHGGLMTTLLEVLAAREAEDSLEVMASCLGLRSEADELLLVRAEDWIDPRAGQAPAGFVEGVRVCLQASEPGQQRVAARILASLGDVQSVEPLCGMLASSSPSVVLQARGALVDLAAQDLGPDPEAWLRWLRAERLWRDNELPRLEVVLATGEPYEAVLAVRELTRRRIDRAGRARAISGALGRDGTDLVRMCCEALQRVGSREDLPALQELSAHPDAGVRRAAENAAQALGR